MPRHRLSGCIISEAAMDILLIENNPRRRVATARHLAMAGHRVTLSSSIREAREVMQFVEDEAEAPAAVVIAEALESRDRSGFHEEIADRFPDAHWIPLRADLSFAWLEDWLSKTARRRPAWRNNVVRFPLERRMSFQKTTMQAA
jgi:DNA-binding NarL/FixJ family response regulator